MNKLTVTTDAEMAKAMYSSTSLCEDAVKRRFSMSRSSMKKASTVEVALSSNEVAGFAVSFEFESAKVKLRFISVLYSGPRLIWSPRARRKMAAVAGGLYYPEFLPAAPAEVNN